MYEVIHTVTIRGKSVEEEYCILLYLLPVLNPKSYGGGEEHLYPVEEEYHILVVNCILR